MAPFPIDRGASRDMISRATSKEHLTRSKTMRDPLLGDEEDPTVKRAASDKDIYLPKSPFMHALRRPVSDTEVDRDVPEQGRDLRTLLNLDAVEWYLQQKYKRSRTFFVARFYFYLYSSFLLLVVFVGAFLLKLFDERLSKIDAIFFAMSSVTQAGMSTVNFAQQQTSTFIITFACMTLGCPMYLSLVPVFLRRRSFHKHYRRKVVPPGVNVEYDALGKIIKMVLGYAFVVQATGLILFYLFIFREPEDWRRLNKVANAHWYTFYTVCSGFYNNGLTPASDSVHPLFHNPPALYLVGIMIMLGNTGFPIMLRVIATGCWFISRSDHDTQAYQFILEYPRRCYTHIFPGRETRWLFFVLVSFVVVQTSVILWQSAGAEFWQGISFSTHFANALFLALSARTAGLSSVDPQLFGIPVVYMLMVCMYISTSPTVVTMRSTVVSRKTTFSQRVSDARTSSVAECDITGKTGIEQHSADDSTIRSQTRRYMTQDVTILVVLVFFILCFERHHFEEDHLWTQGRDWAEFSFLKVCFEVCSAYGTVGLSLAYLDGASSFSAAWTRPSQILLMVIMFMGRLRGLPESIDPSVRMTFEVQSTRPKRKNSVGSFLGAIGGDTLAGTPPISPGASPPTTPKGSRRRPPGTAPRLSQPDHGRVRAGSYCSTPITSALQPAASSSSTPSARNGSFVSAGGTIGATGMKHYV
mmetsp:Transcript_2499/g.5739  ORF Transcript_2499/g.5739 Transcript_2499/m.5739 type:complete len:698 (+) Transcript_2499:44-2137(+)